MKHLEPIDDEFIGATEADIQAVEDSIGARLPADFRSFHMTYGWCGFAGDANVRVNDHVHAPISNFFGGGVDRGSLLRDLKAHDDYVAEKLVPIATDDFDNRFVLDAKEGFAVYWINYSKNPPEITKVANSFSDLLARIEVEPY